MRVFIAEANEAVLERLARTLSEVSGCQLAGVARDSAGLRERLPRSPAQLLMLGQRLRDGSGFEALKTLRPQLHGRSVLMLCDQIDGHYLFNARALGADYLLELPRDYEHLLTLLRQLASFSGPVRAAGGGGDITVR